MATRRLFTVFLVLLQSGLAAAHAHAHANLAGHTEVPHLHGHEILDLILPEHDDHEDDGGGHDADALDLSDLTVSAPAPPAFDGAAFELAPPDAGVVFASSRVRSPFPIGLPPSTAGPSRPLYLTLCSLRN